MVDTPSIFPAPSTVPVPSTAPEPSNSVVSNGQLVENFDTFLELLVAQIQNQDPTSPVDTETFTQQLVQFSELEQTIQSNSNLESILSSIESQNAASVVSYIGATVTAEGAQTTLNNGQAAYNLNASNFASDAQITLRDDFGNVVFQTNQALQAGNNSFIWDGIGNNGQQFNDGQAFSITVEASDANGNFVDVSTAISGVVDGVDFSGAVPNLRIGSATIPLNAVSSVNATVLASSDTDQPAQ
ncbi:MAG: flagellar hook capping FlgD N-terminal domain-containing protein [Pseudomonadota bacterium]